MAQLELSELHGRKHSKKIPTHVYLARQTFQLTNEEQNKKTVKKNNRVLPLKKKIFFFTP